MARSALAGADNRAETGLSLPRPLSSRKKNLFQKLFPSSVVII
jgi:hypothetical protein